MLEVGVVVAPRELDQSGTIDVVGDVFAVRERGEATVNSVEDEHRNVYRAQQWSSIGFSGRHGVLEHGCWACDGALQLG